MPRWNYITHDRNRSQITTWITDHELAWALARTVLGFAGTLPQRRRFAALMQTAMDIMIEPASGPLQLIANYQSVFRDFSGTSRVGELAQALTYHHFATTVGYSHVADFVGWCHARFGAHCLVGNSTPDFLLLNAAKTARPVGVLEAKGSVNPRSRSTKLKDGKAQADCGETFLGSCIPAMPVHNKFAAFASFRINGRSSPADSVLRIIDPARKDDPAPVELYESAIRASYSSFFAGLGHEYAARLLLTRQQNALSNLRMDRVENGYLSVRMNQEISPLTGPDSRKGDQRWDRARFLIQADVVEFLNGDRGFSRVAWPIPREGSGKAGDAEFMPQQITRYNDGTALLISHPG